jgi:hypothetical protein
MIATSVQPLTMEKIEADILAVEEQIKACSSAEEQKLLLLMKKEEQLREERLILLRSSAGNVFDRTVV